jgi:hypothetical protein
MPVLDLFANLDLLSVSAHLGYLPSSISTHHGASQSGNVESLLAARFVHLLFNSTRPGQRGLVLSNVSI